jgi:hypothetical protein
MLRSLGVVGVGGLKVESHVEVYGGRSRMWPDWQRHRGRTAQSTMILDRRPSRA